MFNFVSAISSQVLMVKTADKSICWGCLNLIPKCRSLASWALVYVILITYSPANIKSDEEHLGGSVSYASDS